MGQVKGSIMDISGIPPELESNLTWHVVRLAIRRVSDYASNHPIKKREFNVADVTVPVKPAVKTEQALRAYKALQDYSRTPYGAMMIKNILQDHKIPGRVPFRVRRYDGRVAAGSTDFIQFPSEFPRKTVLDTGEIVNPSAIIHHEFGHTRYAVNHKRGLVTMQDERIAVINMENPARMFDKDEPCYTYFNDDENAPETINVITGEVQGGTWIFDKTDPRIMIKVK